LIAVALLVLFAFPPVLRMVSWTAGEIGLPHWLLYSFARVTAFLVLGGPFIMLALWVFVFSPLVGWIKEKLDERKQSPSTPKQGSVAPRPE
jgi:hypothetical protein